MTPLCSQTERAREVSVPARLPPEHFGRRFFPNPFMLRTPSMNPANSYSLFYFPGNVELLKADLEGQPAVKTNGEMETQTGATEHLFLPVSTQQQIQMSGLGQSLSGFSSCTAPLITQGAASSAFHYVCDGTARSSVAVGRRALVWGKRLGFLAVVHMQGESHRPGCVPRAASSYNCVPVAPRRGSARCSCDRAIPNPN